MTGLILTRARTFGVQLPALPVLNLGSALIGITETLQQAYALAYVEPFRTPTRDAQPTSSEGRPQVSVVTGPP